MTEPSYLRTTRVFYEAVATDYAGRYKPADAKTRSGQTAPSAAINEGHADVQAVLERHLARLGDS
jgi:hypothetical protein